MRQIRIFVTKKQLQIILAWAECEKKLLKRFPQEEKTLYQKLEEKERQVQENKKTILKLTLAQLTFIFEWKAASVFADRVFSQEEQELEHALRRKWRKHRQAKESA